MYYFLSILISYLLGSIPTGYIIAKKIGQIDIRRHGSGNIGFTNVLRVMGIKPATIVLIADVSKGALSTLIGYYLAGPYGAIFAGLAVILGNLFSVFLGFKGGKMAATGLGVVFALGYREALIAVIIFLLVLFFFRYVSLASITTAISVPITMLIFKASTSYIIFTFIAASLLILKHKANIKRLLNGTESKIGQKVG